MFKTSTTDDPNLLLYHQFNHVSGNPVDSRSGIEAVRVGAAATQLISNIPTSDSQFVVLNETTGVNDFLNANVEILFSNPNTEYQTTVHHHTIAPNTINGIAVNETVTATEYWEINRYEPDPLLLEATDISFKINTDLNEIDPIYFMKYKLYHRENTAEDDWVFIKSASSANEVDGTITFQNIDVMGQFMITQSMSNDIEQLFYQ